MDEDGEQGWMRAESKGWMREESKVGRGRKARLDERRARLDEGGKEGWMRE